MIALRKTQILINSINRMLVDLPTPTNISYWWNLGSILGTCIIIQLVRGILLSIHYNRELSIAFTRVIHIIKDVNNGWIIRYLHINTASLFFILIYLHISRGLIYSSYSNKPVWTTGLLILLRVIGIAFLGYVLPWGQISFWGATVITNLLSAIPILGNTIVIWVWGGYSVDNPTLTRFFSLHFIIPFLSLSLIIMHLIFLHEKGSSSPLGRNSNLEKIPFHPFFILKDRLTLIIIGLILTLIIRLRPLVLCDVENYIPANPLVTPPHIQPEWYFLFAYAILRSIPSKLGGVIGLLLSILVFILFPIIINSKINSSELFITQKIILIFIAINAITLTWLGAIPVEFPFIGLRQISSFIYFFMIIIYWLTLNINASVI